MKTIAVLLTVFNRKKQTINCLQNLFEQVVPNGYTIEVYLVDDACTDGTPEAVNKLFHQVNVINGSGDLFWNRGMHLAWTTAAKTKDYDFYIWLNDDTFLFKNAISTMLKATEQTQFSSIICGSTCSEKDEKITYGGFNDQKRSLLTPNGQLQECKTINGNVVLVPKKIYKKIGNLDWTYRHAIGDFDYGLRAVKAGFKNYVAPTFVGICELNLSLPKWCLKETPLKQRFKLLYSPLGYAEPIPFFVYEKRHFGLITAIKHFITINIRALIPQLWN